MMTEFIFRKADGRWHAMLRSGSGVLLVMLVAVLALLLVAPAQAQADDRLGAASMVAQESGDTTTLGVKVAFGQSDARSMLDLINRFRSGELTDGGQSVVWARAQDGSIDTASYKNLKALAYDYELEKVAMQRAAEIALKFSHARPDGTICSTLFPGGYSAEGENIAYGWGEGSITTAQKAFEGWCETNDSYGGQGHRRNMLSGNFNRIGIGHAVVHWSGVLSEGTRPYTISVDVHFWTQELGYRDDGVGLEPTPAQDDSAPCVVQVDVLSDSIQRVSMLADESSFTLGLGQTRTFDGVSCGVRTSSTYPTRFNFSWSDGATSIGTYYLPVEMPYDLKSDDASVASVSGRNVTGVSVGAAMLTASSSLGAGAEAAVPVGVRSGDLAGASVILPQEKCIYDGTAKRPDLGVEINGVKLQEGEDYTVSYERNVNAGMAIASVVCKGSYEGSAKIPFKIEPRPATVKSRSASKVFGKSDPVFSAVVEGVLDGDSLSYSLRRASGEATGSYLITPAGDAVQGNYSVTFKAEGSLTINKANNPVKFSAQTKTVKRSKLKKAKRAVAIKGASLAQGSVVYSKAKVNKKARNFSVNKKTGKITVKKGTPKGTYKVTVKVVAAGNGNYLPATLSKVITIKVK